MSKPASGAASLASHFGSSGVADALQQWARHYGAWVMVPGEGWRPVAGYTGAVLRRIVITDLLRGTAEEVLVKVCPPDRLEGGGHRRAWADSAGEPNVRAHLVEPYPADWPAVDGSILTMQRVAGDGARIEMLSALPHQQLLAALDAVVRWLLTGWNRDIARRRERPVHDMLNDRLAGHLLVTGSISRWASQSLPDGLTTPWIRLGGVRSAQVNPLSLTTPDGRVPQVRAWLGRAHRDLHLDNVVVPDTRWNDFQLIDLATYDHGVPLTDDPVTLVLAAVVREVAGLNEPAGAAIRSAIVDRHHDNADGPVFDVIRVVRAAVEQSLGGWDDDLDRTWLTSVIGTALLHTTFERLPPAVRWWCFALACDAADRLLGDATRPEDAERCPVLDNPFRAESNELSGDAAMASCNVDGLLTAAVRRAAAGDAAGAAELVAAAVRQIVDEPGRPADEKGKCLAGLRADAERIFGDDGDILFDIDYARSRVLTLVPARIDESFELLLQVYQRASARLGVSHPATQHYRERLGKTPYV